MPKRILISAGPVHAYLDDVKLITNRFKGGRMAALADDLAKLGAEITFLHSKDSVSPTCVHTSVIHDGFDDYMKLVTEFAQHHDAVVLGAAVANLIPKNRIVGKFPSHNYKVGDTIPIDFTIAPRVINLVKEKAPKTQLFGFKLLSGVEHDELVRAAYEVVLDSHATAVFANDASWLDMKYAVTKERSVIGIHESNLAAWIWESLHDEYYHTVIDNEWHGAPEEWDNQLDQWKSLINKYSPEFTYVEGGFVFGTVAVRLSDGSFFTTGRGKKETDVMAWVKRVDHDTRTIYADQKATLNAPLLDNLFRWNLDCTSIVHYHEHVKGLNTLPYAPPGTVRDSHRKGFQNANTIRSSFNIQHHGCFMMFSGDAML